MPNPGTLRAPFGRLSSQKLSGNPEARNTVRQERGNPGSCRFLCVLEPRPAITLHDYETYLNELFCNAEQVVGLLADPATLHVSWSPPHCAYHQARKLPVAYHSLDFATTSRSGEEQKSNIGVLQLGPILPRGNRSFLRRCDPRAESQCEIHVPPPKNGPPPNRSSGHWR